MARPIEGRTRTVRRSPRPRGATKKAHQTVGGRRPTAASRARGDVCRRIGPHHAEKSGRRRPTVLDASDRPGPADDAAAAVQGQGPHRTGRPGQVAGRATTAATEEDPGPPAVGEEGQEETEESGRGRDDQGVVHMFLGTRSG